MKNLSEEITWVLILVTNLTRSTRYRLENKYHYLPYINKNTLVYHYHDMDKAKAAVKEIKEMSSIDDSLTFIFMSDKERVNFDRLNS